ncbi:MAG: class I SAM-dependent methyltransferase [Candidatus Bathyarchaeia archaeon]|jgi:SAM-dependent methyltransferase
MEQKMKKNIFDEEAEVYNNFAAHLAHGIDVVDRRTYDIIIVSRRKSLLTRWLAGKKGLLLDFGCGDGYFLKFLHQELGANTVGVDISNDLAKYALSTGKDVNYIVADCHNLPFEDHKFDSVIAIGIMHHLSLHKAISECRRLLKSDGFLITFEPNLLCPVSFLGRTLSKTEIHTPHERALTLWSFIDEAKNNGFKVVEVQFLSFFGFIFSFIWASKFAAPLNGLKRYAKVFQTIDRFMEKIPVLKDFCWQFGCKCEF